MDKKLEKPASDPAFGSWKAGPRRSILIFPVAVFLIFTTIAFADDILAMGREPAIRFSISVVLSGLFASVFTLKPTQSIAIIAMSITPGGNSAAFVHGLRDK